MLINHGDKGIILRQQRKHSNNTQSESSGPHPLKMYVIYLNGWLGWVGCGWGVGGVWVWVGSGWGVGGVGGVWVWVGWGGWGVGGVWVGCGWGVVGELVGYHSKF